MVTKEKTDAARAYFNAEPFVDRSGVSMPDSQARIANALEFIAYQLWLINGKMKSP
jgi:hypothetical protein